MTLVISNTCGLASAQPSLLQGNSWTLTAEEQQGLVLPDARWKTFNHGDTLIYRLAGLRPEATYLVRFFCFNVVRPRSQHVTAKGKVLIPNFELPLNQLTVKEATLSPELYRSGVLDIAVEKGAGAGALVSALEVWSDQSTLLGPAGCWVRFKIDQLPPSGAPILATLKAHFDPWNFGPFGFNPDGAVVKGRGSVAHTQTGLTPWYDLRKVQGFGGECSLLLDLPAEAQGELQFSYYPNDTMLLRSWDWNEPDGKKISFSNFDRIRTFRDHERENYLLTFEQTGPHLFPLARPPLRFSNAWGYTTDGAAEYMVKGFRLLGLNTVATSADAEKYADLYGWQCQGQQYAPPYYYPFDEPTARAMYSDFYTSFFKTRAGKNWGPHLGAFQVSDEPVEIPVSFFQPTNLLHGAFVTYLQEHGAQPEWFGKSDWNGVNLSFQETQLTSLNDRRLYYWSRHYQRWLTPKVFSLACEAVRQCGPNSNAAAFVALSGHRFYMPSQMPLDMFQLASYPSITPGISDWMNNSGWRWDSGQAVAFSVAPFNAGARRYGKDFGQPPITFPMMHCVYPDLLRVFTQLANQCKLISYYNYGPSYEVTEAFWSGDSWCHYVVHEANTMAARVDDLLGPGALRPSHVAMLYSMANELWYPKSSLADKRAAFLGLSHEYFQPDLINEDQIAADALDHYTALYVMDSFVPHAAQDRILQWVKAGGLLWFDSESLVRDEYNEPYDAVAANTGLKRIFGKMPDSALTVAPVKGEADFAPHSVPPNGCPSAIEWPGARIRATYKNGGPAWLEKSYGKGKIVYLGHRCGLAYTAQADRPRGRPTVWSDTGRALLTTPLHEARIERDLVISTPLIMALPLSSATGTVIPIFSMKEGPATNLTITLKEPARPVSVQGLNAEKQLIDLPYDYRDGTVVIRLAELLGNGNMIAIRRVPAPPDPRLEQMRLAADKGLASSDWQTLSAAAWFAGFFPEWKMADRLPPLLKHDHWAVRRSAAEALGLLHHKEDMGSLREALGKETDRHVKAELLLALARLKDGKASATAREWLTSNDSTLVDSAQRALKLLGP